MSASQQKIQRLLIKHLLEEGSIRLRLPGQMVIEIGIVQENEAGCMVKVDDYSWTIVTQDEREVFMDNMHQGLKYRDENELLFEEREERIFSVV